MKKGDFDLGKVIALLLVIIVIILILFFFKKFDPLKEAFLRIFDKVGFD